MELLVAIGVFGFVGALAYFFLAPKTTVQDQTIRRRLEAITPKATRPVSRVTLLESGEETFWEKITQYFLGEEVLAEKYTAMRKLLHQAGFQGEKPLRLFWGVRILLAGALGLSAVFIAALSGKAVFSLLMMTGAAAAIGYLLPYIDIRRKARLRLLEISEALPDTLDLLVVCVEAGMGIDGALVRVAKEQAEQGLAIGQELQLMSSEIQAGVPRREALSRLGDRLGLEDLQTLASFLIQTEQLGGSIARSLRVYAATMRQKRSQRAEEAARKAVIKLLFPLALFIMPALFLLVFSPAAINIMKLFATAPGK